MSTLTILALARVADEGALAELSRLRSRVTNQEDLLTAYRELVAVLYHSLSLGPYLCERWRHPLEEPLSYVRDLMLWDGPLEEVMRQQGVLYERRGVTEELSEFVTFAEARARTRASANPATPAPRGDR
jgi:hypothetical protein